MRRTEAKATGCISALTSISGFTWGTKTLSLRILYRATVAPIFCYAASIWYRPDNSSGRRVTLTKQANRAFSAIQRRTGSVITNAYRTTAGPALNAELNLLPAELLLEQAAAQTWLRVSASPAWAVIKTIRNTCTAPSKARSLRNMSPIERLARRYIRKMKWLSQALPLQFETLRACTVLAL